MNLNYCIKENDNFYNVKDVLKNYFNLSSRVLVKLKKHQLIFLNNEVTYFDKLVNPNDKISFSLDYNEDNSNIIPKNIKLDIIYEDEYMLILNKPSNIAIHPSFSHFDNTLSNGIKFYFDQIGLNKKIRIVNRLDKDTSGIVVVAKNEYIQEILIKQMQNNAFKKYYLGILDGIPNPKFGTINEPISRKPNSIIERCVNKNGVKSITHYKVIKELNNMCLVEFQLETGRTHQIRVHSSYIGHAIVGDTLYGKKSIYIDRQALHCYKISFIHPINKKYIEFISNMPQDMINIIT